MSKPTDLDHFTIRIKKLTYYEILDSPKEQSFDQISELMTGILDVENAGICFITQDDIFYKSQIGEQLPDQTKNDLIQLFNQTPTSFDGKLYQDPFLITTPITTPEGLIIGLLYAFGKQNLEISEKVRLFLQGLANMVLDKLETRIAIRKTLTAQDDRLHVLIHDLKNPMTTISLQSELVSRMPGVEEKVGLIATKINQQSKRMVDQLNSILTSAKKINGSYKPQKQKIDLKDLLMHVVSNLEVVAAGKNQSFSFKFDTGLEIFGDSEKIGELFYHLIHNALKFSYENSTITFFHLLEDNMITIAIKDEGNGLTDEDLKHLFIKFAPLTSVATNKENANGLGLILAKMFVDMHRGKLWAESAGKNQGTTFFVQLPIK